MKDENLLTRALQINSDFFISVDQKFKRMGKMPYGKVKATPKEQREAFLKKTPQDIKALVAEHGFVAVNEYIRKMMEEK